MLIIKYYFMNTVIQKQQMKMMLRINQQMMLMLENKNQFKFHYYSKYMRRKGESMKIFLLAGNQTHKTFHHQSNYQIMSTKSF